MKASHAISLKRSKKADGTKGSTILERYCAKVGHSDKVCEAMTQDVERWITYHEDKRTDEVAKQLDRKVGELKAAIKATDKVIRYNKDSKDLPRLIANLPMREDTYNKVIDSLNVLVEETERARSVGQIKAIKTRLPDGYAKVA